MIVGFHTRLTALGLAIDMLGAIFLVHLKEGFFAPKGYEFVLALFAAATALAFGGAGAYSIDEAIARRRVGDPGSRTADSTGRASTARDRF